LVAAGGVSLLVASMGCQWIGRRHQSPPVVLVVVDTLRADHLGLYGYKRPTSPRLDAWAEGAAVFDWAFSASPWTLTSFGSIYTGLLPSRHGAGVLLSAADQSAGHSVAGSMVLLGTPKSFGGLDPSVPTLAETLAAKGYATAAVVNNPFMHPLFGIARGFQSYDYMPGSNESIRRADTVVDHALAWVEAHRTQPFFLLVHFIDPHMNYDAPPPFRGRFTGGIHSRVSLPVRDPRLIRQLAPSLPDADRAFITAAYDEEIAFVDDQLGRLLEGLRKFDVPQRGLIVITADHGEELFDHDGFEHGHSVYDELLHVPLLIEGKGVRPGRRRTAVSLVDIAPTVLAAAGLPAPAALAGTSLWAALTTEAAVPRRDLFAERLLYGKEQKAVIHWPYKLILGPNEGEQRLFNLVEDAGEHHNRAAEGAETASLAREAERVFAAAQTAPPPTAAIDAATREKLRALGYGD